MPTKAIGTGTCNIAINVPIDERSALGKLAFAENVSMGELFRRLVLRGLESTHGERATRTLAEVREVRRRYYGTALLALFVGVICIGEGKDLRRAGRRNRSEEIEIEEVMEA